MVLAATAVIARLSGTGMIVPPSGAPHALISTGAVQGVAAPIGCWQPATPYAEARNGHKRVGTDQQIKRVNGESNQPWAGSRPAVTHRTSM